MLHQKKLHKVAIPSEQTSYLVLEYRFSGSFLVCMHRNVMVNNINQISALFIKFSKSYSQSDKRGTMVNKGSTTDESELNSYK